MSTRPLEASSSTQDENAANNKNNKKKKGDYTKVVFVLRRNAKSAKTALEDAKLLHPHFRMTPAGGQGGQSTTTMVMARIVDGIELDNIQQYIAIPVVKNYEVLSSQSSPPEIAAKEGQRRLLWDDLVEGTGIHWCPYSTSVLGNRHSIMSTETSSSSEKVWRDLNLVQNSVLQTILHFSSSSTNFDKTNSDEEITSKCSSVNNPKPSTTRTITSDTAATTTTSQIVETIKTLNRSILPTSCEVIGDDRTLVITPYAFVGDSFETFLYNNCCYSRNHHDNNNNNNNKKEHEEAKNEEKYLQELWKNLATNHGSSRIVRRGTVDPNSKIRESGYRLVWPIAGIPNETGPGSPGWITVTEQGIKQSFDMTRVMFSRGNISEKIRFGRLVVEGDNILDLYAGIGYYTLPAVIHGKASHVVACEWNEYAVEALRYNVHNNHVDDRVTILVGDCRIQAKEHHLVNKFDRVSLGLLPSSEGGWRTAICALKSDLGGWLHVHANVPDKEVKTWTLWVCHSLLSLVVNEQRPKSWSVICTHVERVKSFAPTVSHFVADIYVGPCDVNDKFQEFGATLESSSSRCGTVWDSLFIPSCIKDEEEIQAPSCALSSTGVLNQAWMREE